MLIKSVFLLAAVSIVGVFAEGHLPCQNTQLSLERGAIITGAHTPSENTYGGAPEPTTAPNIPYHELLKRQTKVTTVCGLLSTDTTWSYNCSSSWYCGTATADRNIFGCCTAGQCYQPTTCYDYTIARSLSCGINDRACTWSAVYCTNSLRPYCGKFINGVVSALDCFSSPGLSYQLIAYTGGANVITINSSIPTVTMASTSSSSSITGSTSSLVAVTAATSSATDRIPFTQSQVSVDNSTPAARTSSGMAAPLGQAGEYFYGLLMSFVLLVF